MFRRSFRRSSKRRKPARQRSNTMPDSEFLNGSDSQRSIYSSGSQDLLKKAQEELQEKPEWRDRDIQALRDMVQADKKIKVPLDDAFLLRFLRARKFDYDRALRLIQQYYLMRANNADLFIDFRPSKMMNVFEENMQTMLLQKDQDGRTVFIFRAGKWNPENCTPDEIFRANLACLEKVIKEESTQINGLVAIVDLKDFGLNHAKYFRPAYAKKVISLIQDCFPGRFKGFHFVHEPTIFDMVFMIVKPFLNEKLKTRIFFHGSNMESLHQHVIPDILPEEFGGSQPPMDNTEFVQTLLDCDDDFAQSMEYGYQQAPKADNMKAIDSIDGIVGSYYRKLCVE